ncbi:MAG: NADH-quinone oxidoreductase subunit M [Bacteroidia bacterium]|nr:NADH-quinone oxidoreductase subunit M [Bacteroidia bacterium]
MLTAVLIIFPFIAAFILIGFGKENAKPIALGAAIIEFALALVALYMLQTGQGECLNLQQNWIESMGISFNIKVDGISMLMVLLSTLLVPLILYSSFESTHHNQHILFALMLMMQGAMIGTFTAADGFLFYIFWELSLIPIYFICLSWGGNNRQKITFKFFIYTLAGSLFMLLALIYLYQHTTNHSFDIQSLYAAGRSLGVEEQGLVLGAFFLAFAVKMPVFPFHTWQPATYNVAPVPGVMMLSGIMLKMATYGLIRWVVPMVPEGLAEYGYIVIALSVISIIYASCIAIVQKDFRYVIAYASIAHVGLMSAGILSASEIAIQGSLVEMLSHGINTVGLFFIYDIIFRRTGTTEMKLLGGIRSVAPGFAFMFFIIVLSVVALPSTFGFIGELLMLMGLFQENPIWASVAGISIILGIVYMFNGFQKMMLGESNSLTYNFAPLSVREKTTLILIIILIIGLGVQPQLILNITGDSVKTLLQSIK